MSPSLQNVCIFSLGATHEENKFCLQVCDVSVVLCLLPWFALTQFKNCILSVFTHTTQSSVPSIVISVVKHHGRQIFCIAFFPH